MRRYKHLRVYDVVTSAAVSLVEVFWTSPADPPPPALTGGVSVANLGFCLQAIQQVRHPGVLVLVSCLSSVAIAGTECRSMHLPGGPGAPEVRTSLQHSQGAFW